MGTIPPFVQQIVGVLMRLAIVAVAGWLAKSANVTLTEDQIGKAVTYVTPIAAVAGWSIYQKYRGRQKLLTALATPQVMTEHEVEAMVKDPQVITPSVNTRKYQLP